MGKKVVRFAIVGTEGIGTYHMDGIDQNEQAVLAAVCDINAEYAKKAAARYGLNQYFTDYDAMLKNGGFDCVIICTPDKFHCEQSIKALEAGYHVLCEKPLTMTLEESQMIVDAAKKSSKKFMVGQVGRKVPGFVLAKELVEKGEIGDLFFVESEYAHDYTLQPRGEWRRDPNYLRHGVVGGGIHAMDLLRWIAGNPTEITSYANHKVLTDWPVDDCSISILKYPNGVIGKVFCSIGCRRPYTMRTVLYGTKGTIIVDNTTPELTIWNKLEYRDGHKPRYVEEKIPVKLASHNMPAEIKDMCDVILQDIEIDVDAVEGANSVAVCLAAVQSAAQGKPIQIQYFH